VIEWGVQIFVADLEEVESLPRHAVMRHLGGIGADACQAYLEHIIRILGEDGPEFHEKLIELYLAQARDGKSEVEKGALLASSMRRPRANFVHSRRLRKTYRLPRDLDAVSRRSVARTPAE
jgi:hypothetical protein